MQEFKFKLDEISGLFEKILNNLEAQQESEAREHLAAVETKIDGARSSLASLGLPRQQKEELFKDIDTATKLRFVTAKYVQVGQLFDAQQTLMEALQAVKKTKKDLLALAAAKEHKPQREHAPLKLGNPFKKLGGMFSKVSSEVKHDIEGISSKVHRPKGKPKPLPPQKFAPPEPAQEKAPQPAPQSAPQPAPEKKPEEGLPVKKVITPPKKIPGREYVHTTAGDLNVDKLKHKELVSFDIPGFDQLFYDALPRDSSILVTGSPGAGKTLLCLQALYNKAKEGHKCLYISFGESVPRLISYMYDFGMNYHSVEDNFQIQRVKTFALARDIEALLAKTTKELKVGMERLPELRLGKENFKPEFVVVDSISALFAGFVTGQTNYRLYLEELLRHFEREKIFVFLISEKGVAPSLLGLTGFSTPVLKFEHYMTDSWINLLDINIRGARQRGIEVVKTRGCDHLKRTVPFEIKEKKGVVIYPEEVIFSEGVEERI
jgi:KaiC/GvpD/RAD55 family RecA-like ATPase